MKYYLSILFVFFSFTGFTLPPKVEWVKFIGYSKYQVEFSAAYEELSSKWREDWKSERYGGPKEYYFEYEDVQFYFKDENVLIKLIYLNEMPFGLEVGMKNSCIKKAFKKRLTKPKYQDLRLKDYSWDFHFSEEELIRFEVTATYELFQERKVGKCVYKGIKFPSAENLANYVNRIPRDFAYLTAENGECINGNCKNGQGKMVWKKEEAIYNQVVFTGNFKNGEPVKGEVTFDDYQLGKIKLHSITVLDGFLHGNSVIEYESGDTAQIRYDKGGPVWSSSLRFLDGDVYEGAINYVYNFTYKYVIGKEESVIRYKDGDVYKFKLVDSKTISGAIYYKSGVTFSGNFDRELRRKYGHVYDNKSGYYLSNDFSDYSANRNAYWRKNDGTYRLGTFDYNTGFYGKVTTYYQNQISLYSVTGEFVDGKKEGKHVMFSHEQNRTGAFGIFKNDVLISGIDVYNDPVKGLLGAKKEEKEQYAGFDEEYNRVLTLYRNKGYRVEGVIFTNTSKSIEFNNQSNRDLDYIIYDPFSGASEYVVSTEGSEFGLAVYNYPDIRLKPVKDSPNTFTNTQGINTKSKTTLFCRVKQVNPKRKKYKAALILISR